MVIQKWRNCLNIVLKELEISNSTFDNETILGSTY